MIVMVFIMMMIVMMFIIIILIIIIVLFLKNKVDILLFCFCFSSFVFNLHATRPVTFIIPSNFVDHDPALVLDISTVTLNPSLEPSVHYKTLAIRCFKNAFFDWQSWLWLEINWLSLNIFLLDTHTSQIIVAFSPIRAFMLDTILINENKDKSTMMFILITIF